jgi:hypothetical protein
MDCVNYWVVEACPILCWLYTFANRWHDLEVWLGIPPGISYFSERDTPGTLLPESLLLLAVLIGFGLVCPIADIIRRASRPGWFRRWLRWLGAFIAVAWVVVVVVSTEPVVQEFIVRA